MIDQKTIAPTPNKAKKTKKKLANDERTRRRYRRRWRQYHGEPPPFHS